MRGVAAHTRMACVHLKTQQCPFSQVLVMDAWHILLQHTIGDVRGSAWSRVKQQLAAPYHTIPFPSKAAGRRDAAVAVAVVVLLAVLALVVAVVGAGVRLGGPWHFHNRRARVRGGGMTSVTHG